MGPKNNSVHFKSVLEFLLINSWSSSQHLHAGKRWRVIPSLSSHLVIPFTLVKWFRFGWQDWWGEILALLLFIVITNFLNPKGHQNPISDSKVTVILLKGLILSIGGVASGRVSPAACAAGLFFWWMNMNMNIICKRYSLPIQIWILFLTPCVTNKNKKIIWRRKKSVMYWNIRIYLNIWK